MNVQVRGLPTLANLQSAQRRIEPHVRRTPVLTSELLDREAGAKLFFKCENFQKVGAFKSRGACNAVFSLDESEVGAGVATHSSGNHAAALARAAARRGLVSHIVMPRDAPRPKVEAVVGYGGRIIWCDPTPAARERACAAVVAETGAALIHPFNDDRIIAGQGTAVLELLADVPDLDIVIAPVGGGGLLAGTAVGARGVRPGLRVFGAEPAQAADALDSLRAGRIVEKTANTIADGLRTSLGDRTFPLIHALVEDILLTSEKEIVDAMRRLWSILKIVVEPSGAVPFASLQAHPSLFAGRRVGIILSGGNVDLDTLPWLSR
jgi:threonine dehydratase